MVDLREGREGFDFLGCHFRARVSGRLMERGIRRYYLHRWPSAAGDEVASERKVKAKTGRSRAGPQDIREVIADLNPILRGWGNYFRTGNAAVKFNQIDSYVVAQAPWPDAQALRPQPAPGPVGDLDARVVRGPGPLTACAAPIRYPGPAS